MSRDAQHLQRHIEDCLVDRDEPPEWDDDDDERYGDGYGDSDWRRSSWYLEFGGRYYPAADVQAARELRGVT